MPKTETRVWRWRLADVFILFGVGRPPDTSQSSATKAELAQAYRRLLLLEHRASIIGLRLESGTDESK